MIDKVIPKHGGSRPGSGRKKDPNGKRPWSRKLSQDVIAYLDAQENSVETLEATVRNSQGFRTWKKNLGKTNSKT